MTNRITGLLSEARNMFVILVKIDGQPRELATIEIYHSLKSAEEEKEYFEMDDENVEGTTFHICTFEEVDVKAYNDKTIEPTWQDAEPMGEPPYSAGPTIAGSAAVVVQPQQARLSRRLERLIAQNTRLLEERGRLREALETIDAMGPLNKPDTSGSKSYNVGARHHAVSMAKWRAAHIARTALCDALTLRQLLAPKEETQSDNTLHRPSPRGGSGEPFEGGGGALTWGSCVLC